PSREPSAPGGGFVVSGRNPGQDRCPAQDPALQTGVMTLIERLQRLNDIGIALSAERDPVKLVEQILSGAKHLAQADAGTIYQVSEDGRSLTFQIIRNDTLKLNMGGSSGLPITFPAVPLYRADG